MAHGIFIGLSTIDVVYRLKTFPQSNAKVVADSQDAYVGGPATNAAIAFSQLGGQSTLVSAVGRHSMAAFVRDELQKFSVHLVDVTPGWEESPAVSAVSVDSAGHRNVISANGTRVANPSLQIDARAFDSAKILMVDGHYPQVCLAWAREAKARGVRVVLDGGSWKDGSDELLKIIDTAICSADFKPAGCKSDEDVVEFLKSRGVARIAITKGPDPIVFSSGMTSGTLTVPAVSAVDTMGAGDVFHGAYCYFAATGLGFVEALGEAAEVASESCRHHGTRAWADSRQLTTS
jgi:sugar/nucleoside kinase (ribokinase family)